MNILKMRNFFKEKIDYFLAFFVPLLALIFSVTVTKPVYMVNDDFVFRSVVEGRYFGIHSEFIYFINFLYMRFLKFLYYLNDNLPWYDLLFALFMFVSLFVITFITNKLLKNNFVKFINSFILSIFSFVFFTTFQFTLVSEILAVSVVAILGYVLLSEKITTKMLIFSSLYVILFSTISTLIRAEGLPLILLMSAILSIFFINKISFSKKKIFLLFLLCFAFFLNRKLNDYNILVHDKELLNFVEYNTTLNFLHEKTVYSNGDIELKKIIKKIAPELKKSNFTENDFRLLLKWYSTGDNIYSGNSLIFLYNNISSKISQKKDVNYIIKKFPSRFYKYFFNKEFIVLQLLIIFILGVCVFKKFYLYKIMAIHFIFVCILAGMDIWAKELPFRVYFPLVVFEYVLMIFSASFYNQLFPKIRNLKIINAFLIVIALFSFTYFGFIKKIQKNNDLYKSYYAIKNFDFSKYKYVFVEPMMAWCMLSPYDMDYPEMSNKILYNWNVYSKYYDYKMNRLNMDRNLYSNFLKDDVYLLGMNRVTPVRELEQSLREHQHIDTRAVKVDIVLADKIFLYKFIPKERINKN